MDDKKINEMNDLERRSKLSDLMWPPLIDEKFALDGRLV
jgi:hypothetical protein